MSALPQVVTRNWRLKLSALALAVFFWAIVTLQPRTSGILQAVPVMVTVGDSAWMLADPPFPAAVTVELGGSPGELLQLPGGGEAVVVRIPLDLVTSSDTLVRLRPDWVLLGGMSSALVESITPAEILLRLEPAATATLPLSLIAQSELAAGLALAQPLSLSPPVGRVRGPARLLEALDSVSLRPLDLSTVTASGLLRLPVDTAGLNGLSFEPSTAQVGVRLEVAKELEIGPIPIAHETPLGLDSATLVFDPSEVSVTLRGVEARVDQIDPGSIVAFVLADDLEDLAPGAAKTVPIRLRGVPDLVRATLPFDSVRVLRAEAGQVPPPASSSEAPAPARGILAVGFLEP